jgi:hypothetical protein
MRDPKRIPAIMSKLEELWLKNPDLRLGQLIINAVDGNHLYGIEDAALIRELVKLYGY